MTLRHGPVNGPMVHAPQDTVETLLRYHAWHLDCLKDQIVASLLPSIERELDGMSGVVEAEWRWRGKVLTRTNGEADSGGLGALRGK